MSASKEPGAHLPSHGHAVAVLITAPEGIPLVRDPKKPAPLFWKVPGGRSNPGETAEDAAIREVQEEVGIVIPQDELLLVHEEDKKSHRLSFFVVRISSLPVLKSIGGEGEEIKVFSPKEILGMPDFFPNHRKVFEKILKKL